MHVWHRGDDAHEEETMPTDILKIHISGMAPEGLEFGSWPVRRVGGSRLVGYLDGLH